MPYVYKYVDNEDGICKYVGITSGGVTALKNRLCAHKREDWTKGKQFTITCFRCDTRSEAEAFESHFISEYGTWKYFNTSKADWGINHWLSNVDVNWQPIESSVDFSQRTISILRMHCIRKQKSAKEKPKETTKEQPSNIPVKTQKEISPVRAKKQNGFDAERKSVLEQYLNLHMSQTVERSAYGKRSSKETAVYNCTVPVDK